MSFIRSLSFVFLAFSAVFASSAEAGWIYRNNSRIVNTPTVTVAGPAEGSITSNILGSSDVYSGLPSTLKLNTKGWASAIDNEAFFSETGQTANTCSVGDIWDWTPIGEEPAQGEIEETMTMIGNGWLDLVNGEAAAEFVLGMKYENSLGTNVVSATTMARSTESRSVLSFELQVALPLGSGSGPQATITIPINIAYNAGETLYRAVGIDERVPTQGCATNYWRRLKISSNIEVFADGWFLDMAVSRAGFEGFIETTTNGWACPQ